MCLIFGGGGQCIDWVLTDWLDGWMWHLLWGIDPPAFHSQRSCASYTYQTRPNPINRCVHSPTHPSIYPSTHSTHTHTPCAVAWRARRWPGRTVGAAFVAAAVVGVVEAAVWVLRLLRTRTNRLCATPLFRSIDQSPSRSHRKRRVRMDGRAGACVRLKAWSGWIDGVCEISFGFWEW